MASARLPNYQPPAAVDDAVLIPRAAAGDRAAWGALVNRYLGPVSAYAWYMLGDRGEAEDVTQETFLRLMGKLEGWDPDGEATLKTWLYRVAINLCIDRHRKNVPVPVAQIPDLADMSAAENENDLDRRRVVRAALGQLPERQRAVMALVYYQGFTNRETGDLLGISVEAVESLLARARRTLRARLAPIRNDLMGRET